MNELLPSTTVVITMAGEGSRFLKAGVTVPKYEIEAHGLTLFSWSMKSLQGFIDAGCSFIFVARARHNVESFLARESSALGIAKHRMITIDQLTDGQATTALLARPACATPESPLAIYNIDTYVDPAALDLSRIRGQGWIPCFPGEGDKWSFAAADHEGRVTEVREKRRISPHATVGLYWFESFELYSQSYNKYYSKPEHLEARERYIAPLYNQLIQDGGDVYMQAVPLEDVYPLGTPEDVRAFKNRPMLAHATAGNP